MCCKCFLCLCAILSWDLLDIFIVCWMMLVKPGLDNATKGSTRADQDDLDKSENGTVDTEEDDDEDDQIL